MSKGQIIISLDFEAAWGVIDHGVWQSKEKQNVYEALRPRLQEFVALLGDLEIACTWATVGAMIDDPEHRDVSYLKGRFGREAQHFVETAQQQSFDGRDLLDIVQTCTTPQKFGTHTYSHLLLSDPEQDAGVMRIDLEKACAANRRRGIAADVLVFPRNLHGYFDELIEAGIEKVRMPATHGPDPYAPAPRLKRFSRALFSKPSPVLDEVSDTGLNLHYASELLNWGVGPSQLKVAITKRRIRTSVEMARSGAAMHFWLHPFDLVEAPGLYDFVKETLSTIAAAREASELEIGVF